MKQQRNPVGAGAALLLLGLGAGCASVSATRPVVDGPSRPVSQAAFPSTALQTAPVAETPQTDPGPRFGRPSLRIYGGYFEASTPQGFANETDRTSLGVGATWLDRRTRVFSLDADLLWTEREFDALIPDPPGLPIPARADLSTIGLSGGGRATFPVEGPVRVYGGLGLGLYWSELSANGVGASSGFSRSQSDFSPGAYVLAGVDVTLGNLLLGLSYRRWFVESDFSDFGLEDVDLGGDFFGLVIGAVI